MWTMFGKMTRVRERAHAKYYLWPHRCSCASATLRKICVHLFGTCFRQPGRYLGKLEICFLTYRTLLNQVSGAIPGLPSMAGTAKSGQCCVPLLKGGYEPWTTMLFIISLCCEEASNSSLLVRNTHFVQLFVCQIKNSFCFLPRQINFAREPTKPTRRQGKLILREGIVTFIGCDVLMTKLVHAVEKLHSSPQKEGQVVKSQWYLRRANGFHGSIEGMKEGRWNPETLCISRNFNSHALPSSKNWVSALMH